MDTLDEFSSQLLSLVMLNVLDEKWKDHLYDLDQLRNAIHYRSWGQKDPLIEYKHEAYTMFVDLMNDVYNTFTERFLRAQLTFEDPAEFTGRRTPAPPQRPTKRYNALGVLEDVTPGSDDGDGNGEGGEGVMDVGPAEPPARGAATRPEPTVVGAGRVKSLKPPTGGIPGVPASAGGAAGGDWTNVGRNDPCPCGSGKKFKKCHGAGL
jgi:preprotein translocase subunit SecA